MTRSLDKDILAHLKADDLNRIYEDISTLLTDQPENELLEIEFLGKSHPLQPGVNYLRDGTAVAIPKLRLAQAFFVARQKLKGYQNSGSINDSKIGHATAVLLLMDPEHLTAANTRKRLLISTLEGNGPHESILRREKQFVDSLLTSRLHRHTKSPVLWSHRRWLLHLFVAHDVFVDPQHDIKNIVMVAGTRHPRNYTAWHHARFLLDRHPTFAEPVAIDVKDFCLKNHTDISCWSFLVHAICKIENKENRTKLCSSIVAEVLHISDSLRWTNESVWVFLRSIAVTGLIGDQQFESFLAINEKLVSITPEDSSQWRTLEGARRWCEKYRLSSESNVAE
ncbi:uncharacterized protein F4822DRAFT_255661 [Hypoxylon trugodes]|uniref:uncharacterized protein n=1 Tax=Hypoxylon trugodes TaxID=326681 RepID=UPI00219A2986|nr:uncharacterized protein F4822DRAFT_255661 [Hypoxylon trugodes]KAI1388744.1 hypothetical protein F4822DRAFT_255661 [Hypoxylon trugodes]